MAPLFPQTTGANCNTGQAAFGSRLAVSAYPTASPWLLIMLADAVRAPQRRKLRHHAVLPHEWQAGGERFRNPIRIESAKIFAIRNRGLRGAHNLTLVH